MVDVPRRLRRWTWLGLTAVAVVLGGVPAPGQAEEAWTDSRGFGLYDAAAAGGVSGAPARNLTVAMTQGGVMAAQAGAGSAEGSASDWNFTLGLYLWTPRTEIDLTVGPLTRSTTIDFEDIVDDFRFGFAGHFEANRGNWTALLDLLYISLRKDDAAAELDYKQLFLEFGGTYRLATIPVGQQGRITLEALAGGRVMAVDAELTIGAQSSSQSSTLVDPMFGGRIAYHINEAISLWFRGDVAGFGISDSQSQLTYNLIAGLNWRFAQVASVFAGWRYMHVDIEKGSGPNRLDANFSMNGPFLGLSFYF